MTPLPALSRKGRGSNHTGSRGSHDPEARFGADLMSPPSRSLAPSPLAGEGWGEGAGINPTPRSRRRPALFTPLPALSRKGERVTDNPPPMGLMVLGDHGGDCLKLTHEGASGPKPPPSEWTSASSVNILSRRLRRSPRSRASDTRRTSFAAEAGSRRRSWCPHAVGDRGHFFGSGMTRSFASRGCRTHASTRVFTLPGFLDTRCRHPPGS